jgi:hypothetical protein
MQQDQQPQISVDEVVTYVGELTIENRFLRRKIMELEQKLEALQPKNGEVKSAELAKN